MPLHAQLPLVNVFCTDGTADTSSGARWLYAGVCRHYSAMCGCHASGCSRARRGAASLACWPRRHQAYRGASRRSARRRQPRRHSARGRRRLRSGGALGRALLQLRRRPVLRAGAQHGARRGAAHGQHGVLHRDLQHLAACRQRVLCCLDFTLRHARDVAARHVQTSHSGVQQRRRPHGAGGQQLRQQAVRPSLRL